MPGAGELTVSRALGDFHLEQLKFRNDGGSFAGPLTAEPEVRAQDLRMRFLDHVVTSACCVTVGTVAAYQSVAEGHGGSTYYWLSQPAGVTELLCLCL
jgi:hypothetical protein